MVKCPGDRHPTLIIREWETCVKYNRLVTSVGVTPVCGRGTTNATLPRRTVQVTDGYEDENTSTEK